MDNNSNSNLLAQTKNKNNKTKRQEKLKAFQNKHKNEEDINTNLEDLKILSESKKTKKKREIKCNSSSSNSKTDFDDLFNHIGKVPPNFVPLFDTVDYEEFKSDYDCMVCKSGNHWFHYCAENQLKDSEFSELDYKDRHDYFKFPIVAPKESYEVLSYDTDKVSI